MGNKKSGCNRSESYQKILIASPQLYRAAQGMHPSKDDTAAVAASYVLGPALGTFVQWLLCHALSHGKERLYFLARDGYLMYHAALIFSETLGLPVDCRYLSCSRYALRLPLFHMDHEAALDYVCRPGLHVTLASVLGRAGLNHVEQDEVIERLGPPVSRIDSIPPSKLPTVRQALLQCRPFLTYMDQHSFQAFPGLAGYLKQEGLLDNIADAIVDSGWVGSMQKTIGQILTHLGRVRPLEGYYWGLYELPDKAERHRYHTYFFGPEGRLREKVSFNNCLFEAIFTAPHGMTLSYREEGGRYLPCYAPVSERGKAFAQQMSEHLLRYVRLLAQELRGVEMEQPKQVRDRRTVRRLLRMFMTSPSPQEARLFGSLPFSDDVITGNEAALAAGLTEEELEKSHAVAKLLAVVRGEREHVRESAWYEGSAVLYGKRGPRHLRQYRLYQYLRQIHKSIRYRTERRGKM